MKWDGLFTYITGHWIIRRREDLLFCLVIDLWNECALPTYNAVLIYD